jgi:hypothetical protein
VLNGKIKTKNHTFSFPHAGSSASFRRAVSGLQYKACFARQASFLFKMRAAPAAPAQTAIFFYIAARCVLKILSFAPTPRQI